MPQAILVVEDHLPTLRLLARLLTRAGYTVHTATDGEEGLRSWPRSDQPWCSPTW